MKLRTVIKITSVAVAALAVVMVAPARDAVAETAYFSTRSVLAEFFPKSERVTFRTFALEGMVKSRLTQRLGYKPAKDRYTIFFATTQGKVDGYAVVDDELGQHQPITFATRLSSRAVVERLEIMVYRETRGDEVRDARFRRQFEGKTAQAPLRLNHDIDAISGATISSASMAVGVRRAAILVEELAMGLGAVAAGPNGAAAPSGNTPR